MDIIKIFDTNVRKYRMEKNVSQEKFAELCGLHRTYISDIDVNPPLFLQQALLDSFKIFFANFSKTTLYL